MNLKIVISAHAQVQMLKNAMLVERKACWLDWSELICNWPMQPENPQNVQKCILAKSSRSQWVNGLVWESNMQSSSCA